MPTEYNNDMVYRFLVQECQHNPALWGEFGKELTMQTSDPDFWERLSERLDCFRICDECGKPMIEGYVVDGCDTYCSEECLHKHLSNEDFVRLSKDPNGDTYWTTWYEDSKTFMNN
jgi:hypothetical protein